MDAEYKAEDLTKTDKIIRLAQAKGDTGILDLIDFVWGDTIYDRLYENIDEATEEEKDEILEELENEEVSG